MKQIILDTNIVAHLNGRYRVDSNRIAQALSKQFRTLASSETFCELLDTLSKGDGSYFASDQNLFRIMVGRGRPLFSGMPGAFALKHTVRLSSPRTEVTTRDFDNAFRCVLHAKSWQDLLQAKVQLPGKRRTCGFDPSTFVRLNEQGKDQHQDWLKQVQSGTALLEAPAIWAAQYGEMLGHVLDSNQSVRFADGLDAVYQFSKALSQMVRDRNYNFANHRSDWADLQQLHFLSSPSVHLLTDDGPLRDRVRNSQQRNRIISFRQFLREHGFAERH